MYVRLERAAGGGVGEGVIQADIIEEPSAAATPIPPDSIILVRLSPWPPYG